MAMVADFLVAQLRETLLDMAKEELAKQIGLVDNIEMLQGTLEELQFYLQDAEKKSIDDASTNLWLCKIKDVIYDIEDVIDEYPLEVDEGIDNNKSLTLSTTPQSSKVCCNYVLSCLKKGTSKSRISARIEEHHNNLKKIMNQIPKLALNRGYCSNTGEAANNQLTTELTRSIVSRPDVVGSRIHLDVNNLVGLLTREENYDEPLVCSIIGTEGIGKSTLARLVHDNNSIRSHFGLRLWVGMSQDRREIDTLRSIIESFSKKDERGRSMSFLQEKFRDMVNGKKVLLVLDDVWEVEKVWGGLFKNLLQNTAARCSCKVLVTTTSKEVALQMKTVYAIQMEPLPLEDGWVLLTKAVARASETPEAGNDAWSPLKDVGIEFVKKCNGLPLAINVVGGILSAESRTKDAWTSVLNNNIWDVKGLPADIHPALYMGYQLLPLHVKQCFLYCCLNPKDVLFRSIISLEHWIQEGFIKDENKSSWYALGESYLKLLVRRNLLEFDPKGFDESTFMMHDVFRSLCRFLTQNENLVANEERLSIKSNARKMKLRRLSLAGGGWKELQQHSSLRSLLIFDQSISSIDNDLFNRLRKLRVLYLDRIRITELPASIGALTLLRYLNLARTLITELPETIGNLKNLRVIIVAACLQLSKLPRCIMNLHRLRVLSTVDSVLCHLPHGLGRLRELRVLEFSLPLEQDVGDDFSSLEELGSLAQLRELTLQKLERVLDVSKARSIALKEKQLEFLQLSCSTSRPDTQEVTQRLEEVFEELCPSSQLKVLFIVNYFGSKLPMWLSPAPSNLVCNNLKFIKLVSCSNLMKFPAFGLLPCLDTLYIEGASNVDSIGFEFYTEVVEPTHEGATFSISSLAPFFPKLKLLNIKAMDNLVEWKSPGGGIQTMPNLEVLHIAICPKLKTLPEDLLCHSKFLKLLIIDKSGNVRVELDNNTPNLEILTIH